jgi:antirestriction protein ArdC
MPPPPRLARQTFELRASARGDSWLKALSDNPSAFLTAAGKAQAAADYVLGCIGERAVG